MSGRLSHLLATRSAGSPSGPGIRHIGTSSPQRKGSAADAGASKLPGPNSVAGKIHKLETDITGMKATTDTLSKRQDVIDTYRDHADNSLRWLTQFGYGAGVLGIGGAMFKFYHYDLNQTNQMKAHIRDVVGSLEKVTMSKFESLESKIENLDSRMDRMESRMERMESRMERMESRMERMESRMERMDQKMEKMDQKIGNLESKMDEISAYLKAKKGWW